MNTLKNTVHLIGNLGKDVELVQIENGNHLAKMSLATNDYYRNKEGDRVQETQWHNLVAWGKKAEIMSKLLKKGHEIAVQGKLTHRSYEDKEGVTKYISEIIVQDFLKITSFEGELGSVDSNSDD
jgi:single-strand DNA-binding protein